MRSAGFWITMAIAASVVCTAALVPGASLDNDPWSALFVLAVEVLGVLWFASVVALGIAALRSKRSLRGDPEPLHPFRRGIFHRGS